MSLQIIQKQAFHHQTDHKFQRCVRNAAYFKKRRYPCLPIKFNDSKITSIKNQS